MSYPCSPAPHEHVPGAHHPNGDAREVVTAALLGIGLMATITVWWWFAMR